ncbi:hypothetical protein N7448_003640 [Penicillium atrosanguineum]|uniref:Uncharacterized protein n=1 Tax=Penicillium atrosanguineum TaxID=1132637 RepID=A0A9W9L7R5_9EURO|nr:SNF2 family helicase [Penicillium atrosanguineum]KAJ5122506.1 hypothetical protein N7526_009443 [Penicillium atrosanguineum]KAJ5140232.1 hypothetical protein N7448_003640 [Penicillium atrosanguineum]KAJ5310149.1 SNF2 family helicase [Penicillium atrosanguineum]KAJ5315665.1 hypothetical protein N7476_005972 [Penicillium atrosanguineum]
MRFIGFVFALVASTSVAMAAPAETNGDVSEWSCPNGWKYCGCVGQGAGDGAICGSDAFGDQVCPRKY